MSAAEIAETDTIAKRHTDSIMMPFFLSISLGSLIFLALDFLLKPLLLVSSLLFIPNGIIPSNVIDINSNAIGLPALMSDKTLGL